MRILVRDKDCDVDSSGILHLVFLCKCTNVSDEFAASIIYPMKVASSLSNVGTLLPEYTASRPTRLMSDPRTLIYGVFLYSNTTHGDRASFTTIEKEQ